MSEPRTAITPNPTEAVIACPFCGHDRHDAEFCQGWSDEDSDEPGAPFPCACSHPDPANYAEVPYRERPGR